MKDILTNALTAIICIFLSSLFVVGAQMFHHWCEKIKMQTKYNSLKSLIEKIDYIVQLCVESTNQTFVNDKKAEDNFTDEDKKAAFDHTMQDITNVITESDKEKIISEFGDLGTFLRNSIEEYIKTSKAI